MLLLYIVQTTRFPTRQHELLRRAYQVQIRDLSSREGLDHEVSIDGSLRRAQPCQRPASGGRYSSFAPIKVWVVHIKTTQIYFFEKGSFGQTAVS